MIERRKTPLRTRALLTAARKYAKAAHCFSEFLQTAPTKPSSMWKPKMRKEFDTKRLRMTEAQDRLLNIAKKA